MTYRNIVEMDTQKANASEESYLYNGDSKITEIIVKTEDGHSLTLVPTETWGVYPHHKSQGAENKSDN